MKFINGYITPCLSIRQVSGGSNLDGHFNVVYSAIGKFFYCLCFLIITSCSTNLPPEEVKSSEPMIELNTASTQESNQSLSPREQLLALPNRYKNQATQVSPMVMTAIDGALTARQEGALNQAKVNLTTLSIENPSLSGIRIYLGDIALQEGDIDAAGEYYQEAVSLNANNYFALNRLASIQRKQGKFALAKQNYLAALESWPAFAPAHLNLGILLDLYLGDKQTALEHYKTYQILTEHDSRQVKGWIKDLSTQLKRQKTKK